MSVTSQFTKQCNKTRRSRPRPIDKLLRLSPCTGQQAVKPDPERRTLLRRLSIFSNSGELIILEGFIYKFLVIFFSHRPIDKPDHFNKCRAIFKHLLTRNLPTKSGTIQVLIFFDIFIRQHKKARQWAGEVQWVRRRTSQAH